MSDVSVLDYVGGRWECLVHMSQLLSEGKTISDLEQLVNQIEEPDIPNYQLPLDFSIKGKRSPQRKKVVFVPFSSHHQPLDDAAARTGKKTGLKLIFKRNLGSVSDVVCTQEPVSKKITIKKPGSENLDRNPRKRRMDSEEEEGTSKKRAKKSSDVMDPVTELPEVFKNQILERGGDLESVVLVIQKELTTTDLSTGHGRLSLPYRKVRKEFLKPREADQSNTEKGGIKTALIEPCLHKCEISLKNWKSNKEYVLVRDWNKACSRNALREGMKVQLWSFRISSSDQLCFALVIVD